MMTLETVGLQSGPCFSNVQDSAIHCSVLPEMNVFSIESRQSYSVQIFRSGDFKRWLKTPMNVGLSGTGLR